MNKMAGSAPTAQTRPSTIDSKVLALLEESLARLDVLLEAALRAAEAAYGPAAAGDPFRGLYISPEETRRLLDRVPGKPPFGLDGSSGRVLPWLLASLPPESPLARLADRLGLSPFDLDILLVGLAPEIEPRYERLYAYLQDDVSRRRPGIDLALNLLCETSTQKLERQAHFEAGGPLLRHGLIHLFGDPNQAHPPLLAQFYRPDESILRLLLERSGLDGRLLPFASLRPPEAKLAFQDFTTPEQQALPELVRQAHDIGSTLLLDYDGQPGTGRYRAARLLAARTGLPLLRVDLARLHAQGGDQPSLLRLAVREAWLHRAMLYLTVDGLSFQDNTQDQVAWLVEALSAYPGVAILAGGSAWLDGEGGMNAGAPKLEVIRIPFLPPDYRARLVCWQSALKAAGLESARSLAPALAVRYHLTPGQITRAAEGARGQINLRIAALDFNLDQLAAAPSQMISPPDQGRVSPSGNSPGNSHGDSHEKTTTGQPAELNGLKVIPIQNIVPGDGSIPLGRNNPDPDGEAGRGAALGLIVRAELFEAARAQGRAHAQGIARIQDLADRIEPRFTWDDIILPPDSIAQLYEICQRALLTEQVLGSWGFSRKLSGGTGLVALFSGPSGTGKTMASRSSPVPSASMCSSSTCREWSASTSARPRRTSSRIFDAASAGNMVLFFDEADRCSVSAPR
jgi:hypothetical protein